MRLKRSVNIFYSYAEQDQSLLFDLKTHLAPLKRQGIITDWHKQQILPGAEWKGEIDSHLKNAQLILLLVSPDFLASDYCYNEAKQALSMHKAETACVIPIILRPADWQSTSLGELQVLPTNGRPVTSWRGRLGRDKAFLDVSIGIRTVIKQRWPWADPEDPQNLATSAATNQIDKSVALVHTSRANAFYDQGRYQDALQAYEEALRNDNSYAFAYFGKGETLYALKRYAEASDAYDMAIRYGDFNAYAGKGKVLSVLGRYDEALVAYRRALEFDPENYEAQMGEGETLEHLGRREEAQLAYEKARRLR